MRYAERVRDQLAAVPKVSTKLGELVSRSGASVVVNVGESAVTLPFSAQQLPPAGQPVQIQSLDGSLVVTGPARPLPGRGVVTALGSPRVTVTAFETTYVLPVAGSYTPVLNDQVSISWDLDGGLVTGSISAPTTVVPPVENPPPSVQTYHPAPFTVVDTASWQSGRWTKDDVWASDSLTGFWFYGSSIADSIPDGAVIKAAAIYLSPTLSSGAKPNLQLHNAATRSGAQPGFVGAQHQPAGTSGWQPIPLSFVDYLKSNASGIGVNHGGYHRFRSRGQDGLTGALDITWEA